MICKREDDFCQGILGRPRCLAGNLGIIHQYAQGVCRSRRRYHACVLHQNVEQDAEHEQDALPTPAEPGRPSSAERSRDEDVRVVPEIVMLAPNTT